MQPIQSITIPQPCHQNWNQMTPVDQGRHCNSCSKTVTDFTAMSNQQIISYFAKSGNVCGRFDEQQLNAINHQLALEDIWVFSWRRFALAAALTSLFTNVKAQMPVTIGKLAISQAASITKDRLVPDSGFHFTITGKVIDLESNSPICDASIIVKSSGENAMTDSNGVFNLKVHSAKDSLVIQRLGYKYQVIKIKDFNNGTNCVALKSQPTVLGGAISIVRRVPFYKVWWYKLKRAF